jgi:hypothetical protein
MSAQVARMKRRDPRKISDTEFESAVREAAKGSNTPPEVTRRIEEEFSPAPMVLSVKEMGMQWEVFLKILDRHHTIICNR